MRTVRYLLSEHEIFTHLERDQSIHSDYERMTTLGKGLIVLTGKIPRLSNLSERGHVAGQHCVVQIL